MSLQESSLNWFQGLSVEIKKEDARYILPYTRKPPGEIVETCGRRNGIVPLSHFHFKGKPRGFSMKNTNKRSGNGLLMDYEIGVISNIIDSKQKYRKIVQAGISQWVRDFQNGQIKVNTVDDLKKLIELDIHLQKDEEL